MSKSRCDSGPKDAFKRVLKVPCHAVFADARGNIVEQTVRQVPPDTGDGVGVANLRTEPGCETLRVEFDVRKAASVRNQ